jgi:large subunit ribosomal protein L18
MSKQTSKKLLSWQRRKRRVRRRISGTTERPRLTIFRSNKHIYAQVVDDVTGVTLAAASTSDREFPSESMTKVDAAKKVGELLAQRCQAKAIGSVVFDRNGYLYQSGRVLALAEGAREGGLSF